MTEPVHVAPILSEEEVAHGVSRPWLGQHRPVLRRVVGPLVSFGRIEASGGAVLLVAALVALGWANSPWQASYHDLWSTSVAVHFGGFELEEELRAWVNDGLMVLFFFVAGLAIKTELVGGELRDRSHAALPAAAAAGGMLVPALLYLAANLTGGQPVGWGVPTATDIAFAVGIVTLLGDRVPSPVKVFLLALAIVDDIGAVLIIALFYGDTLSLPWLATALVLLLVVAGMQRLRVWYIPAYVLLGIGAWLATFESGVHPTIAGVALGLMAPARPLLDPADARRVATDDDREDIAIEEDPDLRAFVVREAEPVADRLERALHPWSSYVVIPVFALANAGVTFETGMVTEAATSAVTLGIVVGLLVGKPLGVLVGVWLATRFGSVALPAEVRWLHVAGVGATAGVGFAMSLFISGLAFSGDAVDQAKLGVFVASVLAGATGILLLRWAVGNATAGTRE